MCTFIENETLEFKREFPNNKSLAKELIAFLNCKGGKLVIGVDSKDQKVTGISPDQQLEEKISNIINDCISPIPDYSISYQTIDGAVVLEIIVRPGTNTPYYLKQIGIDQGTYIKIGSTTRMASRETLASLIRQGQNISYDEEIVSKTCDLGHDLLQKYISIRFKEEKDKNYTLSNSMLDDFKIKKKNSLTVAGALLFHENPQSISELSFAFIQCARFKGKTLGTFIDRKQITGPITHQIEESINFITRNIAQKSIVIGAKRIDEYEYPIEIIREAIVNAVIHRDYSISGSSIQVAIYDDRLEVISPGGLPKDLTPKNIIDRQYNRNRILSKILYEMGYFESWGLGIDLMINWAKNSFLRPPDFIDSNNQFKVILYNHSIKNQNSTHSKDEQKTLALLDQYETINNRLLQEKLKLNKSRAQAILKNLLSCEKIVRLGQGRAVHYKKAE